VLTPLGDGDGDDGDGVGDDGEGEGVGLVESAVPTAATVNSTSMFLAASSSSSGPEIEEAESEATAEATVLAWACPDSVTSMDKESTQVVERRRASCATTSVPVTSRVSEEVRPRTSDMAVSQALMAAGRCMTEASSSLAKASCNTRDCSSGAVEVPLPAVLYQNFVVVVGAKVVVVARGVSVGEGEGVGDGVGVGARVVVVTGEGEGEGLGLSGPAVVVVVIGMIVTGLRYSSQSKVVVVSRVVVVACCVDPVTVGPAVVVTVVGAGTFNW